MKKLQLIILILASITAASPAAASWVAERDPDLGFQFSYPSHLFHPSAGEAKPSFHYIASSGGEAQFMVGAWNNEAGQTPDEFKRWLVENSGGYNEQTYVPRGRSWFVISGYRAANIYYEKVMFSCSGRVVNVLAISYPKEARGVYDPVVEQMEDRFQPSRRCPS
jgi:hypothetical protein